MRRNLKIGAWVEVLHGGGLRGSGQFVIWWRLLLEEPVQFTEVSPNLGCRVAVFALGGRCA